MNASASWIHIVSSEVGTIALGKRTMSEIPAPKLPIKSTENESTARPRSLSNLGCGSAGLAAWVKVVRCLLS